MEDMQASEPTVIDVEPTTVPIGNGAQPAAAGPVIRPPAPRPRKQQRPRNGGDAVVESIENEMQLTDAMALRDQLELLVPDGELKIHISRRAPKVGPNGENVCGTLETVDELIDEDYIRDTWGGGTFGLTVQVPRSDGRFKIFRRFQLKIAGEPKMHGRVLSGPAAPIVAKDDADPLAVRAFDAMQQRELATQARLDSMLTQGARQGGIDIAALQAIVAPITNQLAEAQETIRTLQQAALQAANKEPPRDVFRDELFKEVISGDRSEAAKIRERYEERLQQQQQRYEDRIDRMLDDHAKAITRLEDRHRDELKEQQRRFERELDAMKAQGSTADVVTKAAYDMKVAACDETIKRLERELTEKNSKIGALEAKKDQTLFDKAEEIGKLREVLDDLGGGGEKDEKWYERLINAVGNSEAALNFINKVSGGAPAEQLPAGPQQPQLPPPNVPFRHTDGNVYVHDGQGNFHQVVQPVRKPKKKKPAAPGAEGAAPEAEVEAEDDAPVVPAGRPPDVKEMQLAVQFIENAIRSKDANPETFARGAQNLMPQDVLAFVMSFEDSDQFLATMKLTPGSPLTSVKGRQFLRAVHKYLREGTTG